MEPERVREKAAGAKRPAYVVIGDTLRTKIESQELVPGDRLPSERELVEEFRVARMTVRHALELLQDEGIIERRRGRTGGTFVRALPPILDLNSPLDLKAQLARQQVDAQVVELSSAVIPAPPAVELAFGLPAGAKVAMRERLYQLASGAPIATETTYSCEAAPPQSTRREDVLSFARPTERERTRLELGTNAMLQRVTRRAFAGEELAEFAILAIRSDAARLRAVTAL